MPTYLISRSESFGFQQSFSLDERAFIAEFNDCIQRIEDGVVSTVAVTNRFRHFVLGVFRRTSGTVGIC